VTAYRGDGTLWLDDLALGRPRPATTRIGVQTADARLGNVYRTGEVIRLKAATASTTTAARWAVVDVHGRTLRQGDLTADGTLEFTATNPGWFEFVFTTQGMPGSTRLPVAVLGDDQPVNPTLGMCSHFGQWWPLEVMDLMKRYGIRIFRDEIGWMGVETSKDKLVLPAQSQSWLVRSTALGMDPLLILDYNNPFYDNGNFPNSPDAIAGFARFGAFMAEATRGSVKRFEIWNEWSGGCGMSGRGGDNGPQAYARLQQATVAALRRVRPDAHSWASAVNVRPGRAAAN
jgi:hypothetical protein